MDTHVRTVLMTAPDETSGRSLSRQLVEARLAACASVVPGVTSVFWWEGVVQSESEVLVILKTSEERTTELLRRASELHPYDVPELLVLPVSEGSEAYVRWVLEETVSGGTGAHDEVDEEA